MNIENDETSAEAIERINEAIYDMDSEEIALCLGTVLGMVLKTSPSKENSLHFLAKVFSFADYVSLNFEPGDQVENGRRPV